MISFGVLVLALTFLMGNPHRKTKWTITGQLWVVGGILYWLIENKMAVEEATRRVF